MHIISGLSALGNNLTPISGKSIVNPPPRFFLLRERPIFRKLHAVKIFNEMGGGTICSENSCTKCVRYDA